MDTRSRACLMNIEPLLFELVQDKILKPNNTSISGYLRSLVVADLNQRGHLSQEILTALALGTSNIVRAGA